MKSCPDCLGEIPEAASVCRHCGERVEGIRCPDCGARNWEEASRCRWCGHRFRTQPAGGDFQPFTVTALRIPSFFARGRFLPQVMKLTREKIVLVTPGFFDLSRQEEEIPWPKVAGFDYGSGLFWDRVTIETRGQSSSTIYGLAKKDGERIRAVLRDLET